MPIGKNAIKRITNNGYSNVQTSAPDMENSVVEEKNTAVEEKKTTPKKTASTKSSPKSQAKPQAPKSTPKKSLEKEPDLSPVNTAKKVIDKKEKSKVSSERQGEGYINLGGELPVHLL